MEQHESEAEGDREGWTEVIRRQRNKSKTAADKGLITFFFRNFPKSCSEEDLRRRFETIGKVPDLFIPAKRDKKGKHFAFVRFRRGEGEDSLLTLLNNIWIGSFIIRAFVPRFIRTEAKKLGTVKGRLGPNPPIRNSRSEHVAAQFIDGPSYLAGVCNYAKDFPPLSFQSNSAEKEWLRDAFTARLKTGFSWQEHGDKMKSKCAGLLRLRHLGGNLILIHGVMELSTSEALKGLDDWSQHWFEWWIKWQASDVNRSRIVWTRWIGVPLTAWSARFFESGSKSFGRMVEIHESTEKKTRLEDAFVKVETDCSLVNRALNCSVDGERFSIKIDELPPPLNPLRPGQILRLTLPAIRTYLNGSRCRTGTLSRRGWIPTGNWRNSTSARLMRDLITQFLTRMVRRRLAC